MRHQCFLKQWNRSGEEKNKQQPQSCSINEHGEARPPGDGEQLMSSVVG